MLKMGSYKVVRYPRFASTKCAGLREEAGAKDGVRPGFGGREQQKVTVSLNIGL